MPRIPGELAAKRTSQKKKGLKSKEHKFAVYPPPIATNMEVNLRIVTLVNVDFFLRYGKRRGSMVYWLVVWNMIFMFPYVGNVIIPTDEVIFFRGVGIPPTSLMFQRKPIKGGFPQLGVPVIIQVDNLSRP